MINTDFTLERRSVDDIFVGKQKNTRMGLRFLMTFVSNVPASSIKPKILNFPLNILASGLLLEITSTLRTNTTKKAPSICIFAGKNIKRRNMRRIFKENSNKFLSWLLRGA